MAKATQVSLMIDGDRIAVLQKAFLAWALNSVAADGIEPKLRKPVTEI